MHKNIFDRRGIVLWLTGLSASGKTTIALNLAGQLRQKKIPVVVLDGDTVRRGLSADLGFSKKDRIENVRRIMDYLARHKFVS